MNYKFIIDSDIANAETLPGWFYNSEEVFKLLKEKIFFLGNFYSNNMLITKGHQNKKFQKKESTLKLNYQKPYNYYNYS